MMRIRLLLSNTVYTLEDRRQCQPDTLSQLHANDDLYPQSVSMSIRTSAAQVFLGYSYRCKVKHKVPLM
jgi:hypothetical protein